MGKNSMRLTGVRKNYGGLEVIHGIDLEVQERIRQLRLKDPDADVSGAIEAGAEQTRKAIELIQQQIARG